MENPSNPSLPPEQAEENPAGPPLARPTRDVRSGQFLPGNPGRKPGTRYKSLAALDAIGAENAEAVVRKAMEMALAGDPVALRIVTDRIWPAPRGRPVALPLPDLAAAPDLPRALAVVLAAVARGEITPDDAKGVAALLDAQRRAVETAELADRLATLEARMQRSMDP